MRDRLCLSACHPLIPRTFASCYCQIGKICAMANAGGVIANLASDSTIGQPMHDNGGRPNRNHDRKSCPPKCCSCTWHHYIHSSGGWAGHIAFGTFPCLLVVFLCFPISLPQSHLSNYKKGICHACHSMPQSGFRLIVSLEELSDSRQRVLPTISACFCLSNIILIFDSVNPTYSPIAWQVRDGGGKSYR